MPRYIDADKLVAWCMDAFKVQSTVVGKAYVDSFLTAVLSCETTDVAPRSEVEELVCKLERLLCHATGGKLSKHTYELWVMETAVTDHINEAYSDGLEDGYKECAKEIFDKIYRKLGFFIKHRDVNDTIANMLYFIEQVEKEYTEDNQ